MEQRPSTPCTPDQGWCFDPWTKSLGDHPCKPRRVLAVPRTCQQHRNQIQAPERCSASARNPLSWTNRPSTPGKPTLGSHVGTEKASADVEQKHRERQHTDWGLSYMWEVQVKNATSFATSCHLIFFPSHFTSQSGSLSALALEVRTPPEPPWLQAKDTMHTKHHLRSTMSF